MSEGMVTVNIVEIEQVLLNLIRNSTEAMAEADRGCRTLILRSWLMSPGYTVVSVSDSGRGFEIESVDRIFDPFFTTKPQSLTEKGLSDINRL